MLGRILSFSVSNTLMLAIYLNIIVLKNTFFVTFLYNVSYGFRSRLRYLFYSRADPDQTAKY